MHPDPPRSVLVIKPSSLGDVVHTLPAVHLLRRALPDARIGWIVNTEWAPLLEGNPDLDEVLLFPRNDFRGASGLWRCLRWISKLAWPQPDIALDFQGLTRSTLLARLAGARRVHCLGNAELPSRLLAHRVVPVPATPQHAVERGLLLVADLGVPVVRPLEFPLPPGVCPPGLDAATPFVLLHPFARGAGKSLTPDVVQTLCAALAPLRVVLVGRSAAPLVPPPPPHCINLVNSTSISELVWLCRHAQFVVSVDSGPMHIAAAVTDRLLGIHTWSDPRLVGPYRPNARVWKAGQIWRVSELPADCASLASGFGPSDAVAVAHCVATQCAGC